MYERGLIVVICCLSASGMYAMDEILHAPRVQLRLKKDRLRVAGLEPVRTQLRCELKR